MPSANGRPTAPPSGRLILIIWPLIAIVAVLLALAGLSLEILASARAYVGGESLWSKGQKDAVHHLVRYAETAHEQDFQAFLAAVTVPLGDRKARLELDKAEPDLDIAFQGFLEGRNHPKDIPGMIRLYRWFRHDRHMQSAIAVWTEGDRHIEQLNAVGRQLNALVSAGQPEPAALDALLTEIFRINAVLTPLEERFSHTLGEASREIGKILLRSLLLATTVLLLAGVMISRRMLQLSQRYEVALRSSEASLREAQDLAHLGSWSLDAVSGRTDWSEEAMRIFGIAPHAPAPPPEQHMEMLHPEDRPRLSDLRDAAVRYARSYETDYRITGANGRFKWVHERGQPQSDSAGHVVRLSGTVMDITERKQAEERIRYLAHYDDLTRLPNRNLFNQNLFRTLAQSQRHSKRLALLYIDLDRFKTINDNLGHDAGDAVLKEIAGRLRACLRESDNLARLGGDEFVVLIEDMPDRRDIAFVAQKIIDAVGRPLAVEGRDYHVSASIGISVHPGDGDDAQTLSKHADLAMYRAKERGRNRFEFYAPKMAFSLSRNVTLEAELRGALERDEFILHYQPRVDLASGRITGMEALIRWQHPERGIVWPNQFIGLAEDSGLIVPIGAWVLKTATAQTRAWLQQGCAPLRVSVNLSARQFTDRRLAITVMHILGESGLDPGCLELEITESMVMDDARQSLRVLSRLGNQGVRIAIDDFGTGYSSLAYLKRFPIHSIKIDRAFIKDLPGDTDAAAITQAIIAMARSLNIKLVAEGVETAAQVEFLRAHHCDEVQGYYFSKPLAAEAFEALLRGSASA